MEKEWERKALQCVIHNFPIAPVPVRDNTNTELWGLNVQGDQSWWKWSGARGWRGRWRWRWGGTAKGDGPCQWHLSYCWSDATSFLNLDLFQSTGTIVGSGIWQTAGQTMWASGWAKILNPHIAQFNPRSVGLFILQYVVFGGIVTLGIWILFWSEL